MSFLIDSGGVMAGGQEAKARPAPIQVRCGFHAGPNVFYRQGLQGDEAYYGPFVRDTYHGYGQYVAKNVFGQPWTYEGMFYTNKFHGYGTISYADGTTFSGLFKMGRQFGPGVLTYPDGKQDVGVWTDSNILRLSVTIPGVEHLCNTPRDRIQASFLKKLVPIPQPDFEKDTAEEILEELDLDPDLYAQKLYSRHCKDPRSHLFNRSLFKEYSNKRLSDLRNLNLMLMDYNKTISDDTIEYAKVNAMKLPVPKQQNKEEVEPLLEEASLTEAVLPETGSSLDISKNAVLFSWNNQDIIIELMLHSFKFRRQECITNYDVGDILCNRRSNFDDPGVKEQGCIQMLIASSENDPKSILKLLKMLHLNPDVMDNVGNSMIIQAAAHDSDAVIEVLAQIEANLNSVNDEGFNALTHTLSRYLAMMHNTTDWAQGFMPPCVANDEEAPGKEWMVHCNKPLFPTQLASRLSTYARAKSKLKSSKSSLHPHETKTSKYIFDLSPLPHISKSMMELSIESISSQKAKDRISIAENPDAAIEKKIRMKKIEKTFSLLLKVGVDVNGSVTPAPLLTLSIFTQNVNIIESILKHGVNPNSRLDIDPGRLTPLHVTVLVKPLRNNIRVVELLLEYGANPSLRTEKEYRKEYWKYLLRYARPRTNQEGMTPLHALLLRPDAEYVTNKKYLLDLCCLLAWYSGSDQFLGLNALGLAIAQGNLLFAKALIACSKIKINEKFDFYWGNPLSTYLRIHGTNSSSSAYKMLNLLLDSGADPLTRLSDEENILNFVVKLRKKLREGAIRPSRNRYSVFRRNSVSHAISSHSVHSISQSELFLRLKELEKKEFKLKAFAKKRVEGYIKGVLIRSLLYCMQKSVEDDAQVAELFPKIITYLWDWVDQKELPNLFSMNLKEAEFSDGIALINALLTFINFPELFHKKKVDPEDVKTFLKSMNQTKAKDKPPFTAEKALEIEKNLEGFNAQQLKPAEIDKDGDLYKVCYQCLKRSPYCFLCHMCELVYICSLECNIKDVKDTQSKHKCRLVFWGLPSCNRFVLCTPEELKKLKSKQQGEGISSRYTSSEGTEEKVDYPADFMDEALRTLRIPSPKGLLKLKKEPSEGSEGYKRITTFSLRRSLKGLRKRRYGSFSHLNNAGLARFKKLSKLYKQYTWRENVDSGSYLEAKKRRIYSWQKKNTVCPRINYNILGGRTPSPGIWETYDTTCDFTLNERISAFSSGLDIHVLYERIRSLLFSLNFMFDVDMNNLLPYLVYVPLHGFVLYKSYGDATFENYSFN